MKLLLFSDVHTDLASSRAIAARARNYDLLIGADAVPIVERAQPESERSEDDEEGGVLLAAVLTPRR